MVGKNLNTELSSISHVKSTNLDLIYGYVAIK